MKISQLAIISGILFILLATVCFFCFEFLFPNFNAKSKTVTIPDCVGLDASEIKDTDTFAYTIEYRDAVDGIGRVIAQTPSAGSVRKLTVGSPTIHIKLTVAKACDKIKLANYEGADYRQAEIDLQAKGLKVKKLTTDGEQDTTVRLSPTPGALLDKGDTVTLYVGNGQRLETVTVPSLENLSILQAVTEIISSGLYLGEIEYEYSDTIPSGCVIGQSRTYGSIMPKHTKISLNVSLGTEFEDNYYNYTDNNEVINEIY